MDDERPRSHWLAPVRDNADLWAGLFLVAAGFVAVAVGWTRAADTADLRIQMQLLISGGIGGLAAVIGGAFLVQAHLADSGFRRLETQLDRVTDALLELADATVAWSGDEHVLRRSIRPAMTPSATTDRVVASHAAYHRPECDLLEGRDGLRAMTPREAEDEALAACRVCLVEPVA